MSQFQSTTLPNDIVVLTEHMPHTRGVGISLLVDAGPQDEDEDQSGLAHLCEHAFFLGTEARSEQEIAGLIDTAGGQLGGFTARDYTCLYATISGDYVTYAMDLLGDMLSNSRFSPDRLKTELDVIGHEIDEHEDTVDTVLDSDLKRILWQGDPLGRSILGNRDSIASLHCDDIQSFLHKHYTGDRMIVAAAGQIVHDDFVELANDSFWQLSGVDRRTTPQPAECHGGVIVRPTQQRSSVLNVLLPTPVYQYPNRYALHVLVTLLGGGMSSRLYRELRERSGLAYSATAGWHAYGRGGVISIEASTTPESTMICLQKIFDQLVQLAYDGNSVSEEELWKAKMQVHGQAFLASDSIATRVSRLTTQQHYFGTPLNDASMLEQIEAVQIADVAAVANEVLGRGLTQTAIGVGGGMTDSPEQLRSEIEALRDCFDPAAAEIA